MSTTDQPTYGSLSGDFDPFETKDRVFGAGAMLDPYPRLAELRGECPVHAGSISGRFGMVGSGVDQLGAHFNAVRCPVAPLSSFRLNFSELNFAS